MPGSRRDMGAWRPAAALGAALRVLIPGDQGFIGRNLARRLLAGTGLWSGRTAACCRCVSGCC